MSSDPLSLASGRLLGRYELLAPVAKGGMGQVWVGRLRGARGFHKLVAVKTLLPAGANEDRMERMLLEEARIASLIQHSNVVQTLELGEHEGTLYMVMEWVDGDPLSYLLGCADKRGGIPLAVAVNLVAQTLRGLQAAHELSDETGAPLGVVHRDVSPHNVLVSYSGVAKLLDFGIAKATNQLSSSTATGEIKGKFAYMAPEQILGADIDQRADIFAVGIILYLLTTGRHPFKNHHSAGVLHSITSDEAAARPSLSDEAYPRTLEAVLMTALDKERGRRWCSAEEMRLALEAAVPEAFALGIDSKVRAFVADMVGERAVHKREALRRAVVAADAQLKDSGSLPAIVSSAQSAGSLRAVSVDESASESAVVSVSDSHAAARDPTPESPPTPNRRRVPLVLGALVAFAVGIALVFSRGSHEPQGASSPSSNMVQLARPAPAQVPRASAPSVEPVTSASAPASASASASAQAAARAPAHAPTGHKPAARPPPAKKPPAGGSDLIAPDYAR